MILIDRPLINKTWFRPSPQGAAGTRAAKICVSRFVEGHGCLLAILERHGSRNECVLLCDRTKAVVGRRIAVHPGREAHGHREDVAGGRAGKGAALVAVTGVARAVIRIGRAAKGGRRRKASATAMIQRVFIGEFESWQSRSVHLGKRVTALLHM